MAMEHRECTWTRRYDIHYQTFHSIEDLCVGVHIQFKGDIIEENGSVKITDIGENDNAVLCMTDRTGCCRGTFGGAGEWYFPNNGRVGTMSSDGSFYRNRDQGVVRLNQRDNATMPIGSFCCDIPDTNGTNQRICIMVTPDGMRVSLSFMYKSRPNNTN